MSAVLRLEGVEKRYGTQRVLVVEDLSLEEGDRILITGGNGSGKSTLLKLLTGVIPPDRGRIVHEASLGDAVLGYVPQIGGLYADLTVAKNFALRRELCGVRVPAGFAVVEALGLTPLLAKRVSALSGGYQRLAALAAALHLQPGWLALDEPFSGLDADKLRMATEAIAEAAARVRLLLLASPADEQLPFVARRLHVEAGRLT